MYMVVGWFHFRATGEGQRCFMAYFSTDTKTSRLFGVYMTRGRGGGDSSPKAWAGYTTRLWFGRRNTIRVPARRELRNTTHNTQYTAHTTEQNAHNAQQTSLSAQGTTRNAHNAQHTHTQEFGLGARTKGATSSTLLDSTDIESCFPECTCTW